MALKKSSQAPVIDVYARLSFAADGETIQVDDQVEMGREEVERRGGLVGEVFKDNSLSAWKPKIVRPQWNTMMGRLESGSSNGVWVYDVTRFSRKVLEGERLVELAASGVRVWSHAGEYDLTTADGRRHFREAMVAAAGESDKISERVKRGKLRRARKGRPHGGLRAFGMPGLGPKPDGWEPGDPRTTVADEVVAAERAVIRECYDRLFAGEGISTLVKDLDARGIQGGYNGRWSRRTLARTLSREALAGLLVHNGEIVGEIAGADPIVTREEWERMVALLSARKTGRPHGHVHVLSGAIACGLCGRKVSGGPRTTLPPYPDGSVRREYRCRRSADYPGCGKLHIDAVPAELAVDEAMRARLGDPRRAARMAAHLSKVSERRSTVQTEIARLNEQADQLAEKTAAWGVTRVEKAMAPLLARVDKLTAELSTLDGPALGLDAAADAVAAWVEARQRGDVAAMRAMVKRTFPKLTLAPQTFYNDHGPHRLLWDGTTPDAPRNR
jgi:DNA invertase Pin-like site-specific DNA recombinase